MSQCRKCGGELGWKRQAFSGVLKWVPTNPDGSDHWDLCRERQNQQMTTAQRQRQRMRDAKACPPFWTIPDGEGSFITVRTMPAGFGVQPGGELF